MDAHVIKRAAVLVGMEVDEAVDGFPTTYTYEGIKGHWQTLLEHDPALAHTLIMRLIERLNEAGKQSDIAFGPCNWLVSGDVFSSSQRRRMIDARDYAALLTTLCDAVEAVGECL